MLISCNRPSDLTSGLIGDGAAWLSDDSGAALTNGRPASASRIQWLSGTQTTSSELILRATWGSAITPRILALLGLTLPAGTLIQITLRRPADAGYTYKADTYSQRVVQLPDGSRCAWFVLDDGLDPVIGAGFIIVNDVNGSASIAASSSFDAGEVWVGSGVDIPQQRGWSRGIKDPSVIRRSRGSQLFSTDLRAWRRLTVRFAPTSNADVAGQGLDNSTDWELIQAALHGAAPCVVIPRWRQLDANYIQRGALFASAAKHGAIQHLGGDWYDRDYTFEEIPAAAVDE